MKSSAQYPLLCLLLAFCVLHASSMQAANGNAAGIDIDKTHWPAHLRVLTGPTGGQWSAMGEPIAEILSKTVLPATSRMGGGLVNIDSLNKKNGDIAFSLACFMGAAGSGEQEYQKISLANTALLANVYPQVLYFLLRKEFAEAHKITSVADLLRLQIPLRFASLKPGTASEFILTLLFTHGYGTSFEQLRQQGWITSFNNYAETADNFVDGELDCFAYTAGTNVPLIKIVEEHADIVVLPIEQEVLAGLAEKFKTNTYIIQPGQYRSVTKPVHTLGDYTCLLVRKDLPNDLVFAICKALWEGKRHISGIINDFGSLSPKTAAPAGLPMHPGALEFWSGLNER